MNSKDANGIITRQSFTQRLYPLKLLLQHAGLPQKADADAILRRAQEENNAAIAAALAKADEKMRAAEAARLAAENGRVAAEASKATADTRAMALQVEAARLREEVSALDGAVHRTESVADDLRRRYDAVLSGRQAAERAGSAAVARFVAMESERDDARNQASIQTRATAAAEQRLAAADARCAAAEKVRAELTAAVNTEKATVAWLQEEQTALETRLETFATTLTQEFEARNRAVSGILNGCERLTSSLRETIFSTANAKVAAFIGIAVDAAVAASAAQAQCLQEQVARATAVESCASALELRARQAETALCASIQRVEGLQKELSECQKELLESVAERSALSLQLSLSEKRALSISERDAAILRASDARMNEYDEECARLREQATTGRMEVERLRSSAVNTELRHQSRVYLVTARTRGGDCSASTARKCSTEGTEIRAGWISIESAGRCIRVRTRGVLRCSRTRQPRAVTSDGRWPPNARCS